MFLILPCKFVNKQRRDVIYDKTKNFSASKDLSSWRGPDGTKVAHVGQMLYILGLEMIV